MKTYNYTTKWTLKNGDEKVSTYKYDYNNKIPCECCQNTFYIVAHRSRHFKTKKHIKNLKLKSESENIKMV